MRSVFVTAVLLLMSVPVQAHPGHGTGDGSSVEHFVTSPFHVGPPLAGMVLLFMLGRWRSRARRRAAARASVSRSTSSK